MDKLQDLGGAGPSLRPRDAMGLLLIFGCGELVRNQANPQTRYIYIHI